MGNCCSEDIAPYEAELDVTEGGPEVVVAGVDENMAVDAVKMDRESLDTEKPAEPSFGSATLTPIAPPSPSEFVPAESMPTEGGSGEPSGPAVLENNADAPFVLQVPPMDVAPTGLKPGERAEEDLSLLPRVETSLTGLGGFALIYSQTAGGTLAAKWVQSGPPLGCIAFLRINGTIDDLKLYNQPFQCGRSVRTDWMNQAKALAVFMKQCWTYPGELELLPEFNTALPRRAVFVFHGVDLTMRKVSAPAAIPTSDDSVDACAVMPHVSETFKGQATLKLNAFLEKAVRRGATVRF